MTINRTAYLLTGLLIALALLGAWLFLHGVPEAIASAHAEATSKLPAYTFRSNLPAAGFVRLDALPTVTPYSYNPNDNCDNHIKPATPGGRLAQQRGWRVVQETRYHDLDAVLIVRGYDEGTSAHCFSKDPNLAFFNGNRLIAVLYAKGENAIGMNVIESIGGKLRLWDDLSPVGQVSVDGAHFTFDRVSGSDAVCGGKYRVPTVFNQPYSRARKTLRAAGWIPQPSKIDALEGLTVPSYRERFPEVEDCAGTGYGYCGFNFRARGGKATLSVITAGEADDPNVTSYSVSCTGLQ